MSLLKENAALQGGALHRPNNSSFLSNSAWPHKGDAQLFLDLARLVKRKDRAGKIIAQCPACAENGGDSSGEHLVIYPDGKFGCAVNPRDHVHRQRIFKLIGVVERPALIHPAKPTRSTCSDIASQKSETLLSRIKSHYPTAVSELWEDSPTRCDDCLDSTQAFLGIFPPDARLWIAPDIYRSGKPEHARFFRTVAEWRAERLTTPGTRITPSSFGPRCYSRTRSNVVDHHFAVIETDEIGEGKLYSNKDEFCSLIHWLRESCGWHLAAVVDSGGKSLHAWFHHPGVEDLACLATIADDLGLDKKFLEPSQPWRLPGVPRENSNRWQQLIYLDIEVQP